MMKQKVKKCGLKRHYGGGGGGGSQLEATILGEQK